MEEIRNAIREAIKQALDEAVRNGQGVPLVEHRAEDVAPSDERDIWRETARLFDLAVRGDYQGMHRLVEEFEKRGWYARRDLFTTSDAGAFVPTLVLDRVLELVKEYGVAARLLSTFVMEADSIKLPYTTSELPVYAVNEGSEILGAKLAFQSVTIAPKKYGVIASWTTETDEIARVQYLQRLVRAVARGIARKMDEVLLIADGTAQYHNKRGLLNNPGVPIFQLGTGKIRYEHATVDDYISAQNILPEGVALELTGVYSYSVDRKLDLAKDTSGQYIFGPAGLTNTQPPARRYKYIADAVFLPSAVMPSTSESTQNNKPFAVIGDFSYVLAGIRRSLEITRLDQGLVKDSTGGGTINLATQDARAIRFVTRFEIVEPPLPQAFVVIKTANV